jgi:hypothetical protein
MTQIPWLFALLAWAPLPVAEAGPAGAPAGGILSMEREDAPAPAPPLAAGLWAVVDPATGALRSPTVDELSTLAADLFPAELLEALSTSHDGLYEEETENGFRLETLGRFQSATFAVVSPSGQIETTHDPAAWLRAMRAAESASEVEP